MQRIPLTSDAVTFHGRIVPEGEGLWLGWTNTGISFRFEGRHVAFRFAPVSYTHLDVYKRQRQG